MTQHTNTLPRAEYPRPQFVRSEWLNLNGPWEFAYDDANAGERQRWWAGDRAFERSIVVPFAYQTALSGIGETDFHDVVWYRRSVTIPSEWAGRDLLLHFGAVDYRAKVWVNGVLAAMHEGGHTPFTADISALATAGDTAVIVVRAEDPSTDMTIPRGKQYWHKQSAGIFYTRTTGIWQTVWLEPVSPVRIDRVRLTPDVDQSSIGIALSVCGFRPGLRVRASITFEGELVADETFLVPEPRITRLVGLPDPEHRLMRLWWPERPKLYDVTFSLVDDGAVLDRVESYFGMRKVSTEGGRFLLNNRPCYQKLVLDQGYWPESLLTPPSDEAIRKDIELTKALGFNGARKHQKVEDPRYLYWADKLGLLVWGEMANAYHFSDEAVGRVTREWIDVVERDYNHPCIVTWVPINESWGVPKLLENERERQHLLGLYHLLKSLDSTRPVSTNDGWEMPLTDLFTVHDYSAKGDVLRSRYGGAPAEAAKLLPAGRFLYLPGFAYRGEPLLISEFGGIAFKKSDWEGWGYSGASDDQDFIRRYTEVVEALFDCGAVAGWCYTQLTDVEQEINGLLTYDRQPKVAPEIIRKINRG